jgi:hypothetical protein
VSDASPAVVVRQTPPPFATGGAASTGGQRHRRPFVAMRSRCWPSGPRPRHRRNRPPAATTRHERHRSRGHCATSPDHDRYQFSGGYGHSVPVAIGVATAGRLPNATSEQWLHVTSRPNHGLPCGSVPQNFRVHHVPITSIDESPSARSDLQIFRSRPAESATCASVNRAAPAFRMPYSQTLIAKFHSFGLQAVGATVNIRRESDVIPRLTPRDQHEARSLGRDAGARGEELTWSTCLPRGITKVIHDRLVANGPASASGGRRSC